MFLFCRQFCSWVPSRMGIPFASPWEEEFSRLGNARGPYHWAVKWNKLYVINRWQGRFSPTLCKWWQDAAWHGLHPTGRRLMWDPRAVWAVLHRHRLQAAGCLCLGHCAGFVSLKYEEDAFTLFPGTLTLSAFFPCHPWNGRWLHPPVKLPMGLPSKNDVGLAPGWWFGTGSSAEAALTSSVTDTDTLPSVLHRQDLPHAEVTKCLKHGREKSLFLPSQRFHFLWFAQYISAFTIQYHLPQCNQKTLLLCLHSLLTQRGFVSLH